MVRWTPNTMSKNNDKGGNTLVDVEGEIDAGFTSYGVPSQKGETVDATPKEETGRETMELLPDEAPDPEDLTDQQRTVLEAAVLNPEASSTELADATGISDGNIRNTLRRKVPDWYENTFKQQGRSQHKGMAEGDTRSDPVYVDRTVEDALDALAGQGTAEVVGDELGQSKQTAMTKLNTAEGEGVEAHFNVEGYHNRTKVFTLEGVPPVPRDEIEELREIEDGEEEETGDLSELFESSEETEEAQIDHTEESGGLAELFGPPEDEEESTEESGGFTKWNKGEGPEDEEGEEQAWTDPEDIEGEVTDLRPEIEEIRTVCEYEVEQADERTARLAQYVLDRL